MRTSLMLTLGLLTGCADFELTMGSHTEDDSIRDTAEGESDTSLYLRVDVTPPSGSEERYDTLRPQTFAEVDFDSRVSLELLDPVVLTGAVTAWSASPWRSAVPPGEEIVVSDADVSLLSENTVHATYTRTDDAGTFEVSAVPDVGYRLTIVPTDSDLVMFTESVPMSEDTDLLLDLELGTPLWGTLLDESDEPVADAYIYLENANGTVSSPTRTDEDGHWVLRASASEGYTVLAQASLEGTLLSESPIIASEEVLLTAEGVEVDLEYARPSAIPLTGIVTLDDGSAAENIVVRITSVALDDYPDGMLSFTTDTDRNGGYTAWVVPGEYTVELMPPDSDQVLEITPRLASDTPTVTVAGSSSSPLETTLAGFVAFTGAVVDPQDEPVGDTFVQCAEAGFGGRNFSTYTNDLGVFSILGPATELDCVLSPPDSTGLGITRTSFDGADGTGPTLVLQTGIDLEGTVVYDGTPVEYAAVTIRSDNDRVWAVTVTDGDGDFSVRVAIPD